MFSFFIIPELVVSQLQKRFTSFESIEPIQIQSGEFTGSFALDVEIMDREPRLKALFGSDVTKGKLKAAGVTIAELSESDFIKK